VAVRAVEPLPASRPGEVQDIVLVLSVPGEAVSTPERVRAVARNLVWAHRSGRRVVAVLSATDETTTALATLAAEISERPAPRESDMLLSAGAKISVALCAMAVHDLGVEAISLSGSQAGILTDANYGSAQIVDVRATRVEEALARGWIVLVADGQGISTEREITTFASGRTSSTAVALATALKGTWRVVRGDGLPEGDHLALAQPSLEPSRS
jgi:aspartate kinase